MVCLYVDDRGVSKGVPSNRRAAELAELCGSVIDVKGDAFLARMRDDSVKDVFSREDFTLGDLSADATWVRAAKDVVVGMFAS